MHISANIPMANLGLEKKGEEYFIPLKTLAKHLFQDEEQADRIKNELFFRGYEKGYVSKGELIILKTAIEYLKKEYSHSIAGFFLQQSLTQAIEDATKTSELLEIKSQIGKCSKAISDINKMLKKEELRPFVHAEETLHIMQLLAERGIQTTLNKTYIVLCKIVKEKGLTQPSKDELEVFLDSQYTIENKLYR